MGISVSSKLTAVKVNGVLYAVPFGGVTVKKAVVPDGLAFTRTVIADEESVGGSRPVGSKVLHDSQKAITVPGVNASFRRDR
jgi:hypothetical protein